MNEREKKRDSGLSLSQLLPSKLGGTLVVGGQLLTRQLYSALELFSYLTWFVLLLANRHPACRLPACPPLSWSPWLDRALAPGAIFRVVCGCMERDQLPDFRRGENGLSLNVRR